MGRQIVGTVDSQIRGATRCRRSNGAGWRRFIEAFSALARTGSSGIFAGQFCRAGIGFGVARGVLV